MNKYYNRVQAEFEDILLSLDYSTTYLEAKSHADSYVKEFSRKKHLTQSEQKEIMEACMELVEDWFPDCGVPSRF